MFNVRGIMDRERMKRYELTRSDKKRLQTDPGDLAETLVSQNYNGFSRFGVENFDVSESETGKLGEVKSTSTTLQSDAKGRFRLWQAQHEKLLRADRNGTARYVFVLFDVSSRDVTARMKQQIPAYIGRSIGSRGGWNDSGHDMGKQYKLPIEAVFDV